MGSDFISWDESSSSFHIRGDVEPPSIRADFVLNDRIGAISGGTTIDHSDVYYRWEPFPSWRGYEFMISTDGTVKYAPTTKSVIVRGTKAAQIDTEDDFNDFEVGDLDELLSNE